jgi:hypothetical protein
MAKKVVICDKLTKKLSSATNPRQKKSYHLAQIDQRTIICLKSTNDKSALVAMMCVKK